MRKLTNKFKTMKSKFIKNSKSPKKFLQKMRKKIKAKTKINLDKNIC